MKTLRWLHRWLGLTLGLFISVIGLTGSWLIYDREIASPEYVLNANKAHLPLQMLYKKTNTLLPANKDVQILFPITPTHPYQFRTKEKQIVINQYTGEILAIRPSNYWPFGWLLHLHSELLLGKSGKQITGCVGIGLLLITVIGIYLWRPKKWKRGFRMRLNKSRAVTHYDIHRLIGILSAPILIVALVTGVSLSFSQLTSTIVNNVFDHPADVAPLIELQTQNPQAALDTLLVNAKRAIPNGRIYSMLIPALPIKPVLVRVKRIHDPHPNGFNQVYLHPRSGAIVETKIISQADPAKRWFNWAFPIHTGQVLPGHRWLLLTIGLMPTFLMLTGIYLYLARRFK